MRTGAEEGHASAFPRKSPPWWQPPLRPVEMDQEEDKRARGRLSRPQRYQRREGRSSPALDTCRAREQAQPTPLSRASLRLGSGLGPSESWGMQVLEAS